MFQKERGTVKYFRFHKCVWGVRVCVCGVCLIGGWGWKGDKFRVKLCVCVCVCAGPLVFCV